MIQGLVTVTSWRFKSSSGHYKCLQCKKLRTLDRKVPFNVEFVSEFYNKITTGKSLMKQKYGLFKRKRKKGIIWYYWFYDEDGNRQHKSTGQSTKWEAKQCVEALPDLAQGKKQITLEDYAQVFYIWGECKWIKRRHQRGFSFSQVMASMRRGHLINHIFPKFGRLELKDRHFHAI